MPSYFIFSQIFLFVSALLFERSCYSKNWTSQRLYRTHQAERKLVESIMSNRLCESKTSLSHTRLYPVEMLDITESSGNLQILAHSVLPTNTCQANISDDHLGIRPSVHPENLTSHVNSLNKQ